MSRKKKRDRIDGYTPPESKIQDPWEGAFHQDGFKNELTGIGDFLRDKTKGNKSGALEFLVTFLTAHECAARWRGSDLGNRIVETIPDEMTREGWELSIQPSDKDKKQDAFGQPIIAPEPKPPAPIEIDDTGSRIAEEIEGELERLDASCAIKTALDFERAYGGGAILVGANDGMEDLSQPLNEDTVTEVRHLTALQGGWDGELIALDYYSDPTQPKYGMPSVYLLRSIGVPGAVRTTAAYLRVHESRLLIFPGQSVSHEARVQMRGWGDSIFVRVDEVLSQYGQTWGGIAILMQEFSQGMLAIEGLVQAIGAKNGTTTVTKRALALNMGRSLSRILLIDAKEKFSRDTVSLAGVADMLQQFALRLAAAADMPVALLMGQAPAGLNATGASDIRFFYDRVASRQRNRLLPQLKRLLKLLFKSKTGPTKGVEPARWNVKFRPLYQESAMERADRILKVSQADHTYITDGVVTPEEVTATRFGGSDFNDGSITIDFEGREKMAEQDEKDRAARAKEMVAQAKKAVVPEDV